MPPHQHNAPSYVISRQEHAALPPRTASMSLAGLAPPLRHDGCCCRLPDLLPAPDGLKGALLAAAAEPWCLPAPDGLKGAEGGDLLPAPDGLKGALLGAAAAEPWCLPGDPSSGCCGTTTSCGWLPCTSSRRLVRTTPWLPAGAPSSQGGVQASPPAGAAAPLMLPLPCIRLVRLTEASTVWQAVACWIADSSSSSPVCVASSTIAG